MKLKEQYQELKSKNLYNIILIKSGNFYITFFYDALIFNYLFNYQLKDDKVGFPITNIDKILFELRQNKLNYIINDSNEENSISYIEYSNEQYQKLIEIAKKYELERNNNKLLLERIQYLISTNPNNYTKIKSFIDEL